ncbi:MAG: hypothetical protein MZV70_05630 [Desulfobacterales bacterium]|nr:hypothetical protein [Desulfobacterales bacterium]
MLTGPSRRHRSPDPDDVNYDPELAWCRHLREGQPRHRRPDDAGLQGPGPSSELRAERAPRAGGLRHDNRAVRCHAGAVVRTAAYVDTIDRDAAARWRALEREIRAASSATPPVRCCSAVRSGAAHLHARV